MNTADDVYDAVVVGGGYAGLSAAIWLGRMRRRVLVITSGTSRNHVSSAVHGYPGNEGRDPNELLAAMRKEALDYGAQLTEEWVSTVTKKAGIFTVTTERAAYRAKKLLLATGTDDTKPDIPDFSRYEGKSIWHCPACDGYEYTGKRLAIVGWGEQLADYALEFLPFTRHITVLTHGHKLGKPALGKLQQHNISVFNSPIAKLQGENGQLERLQLSDGREVECAAMFYSIGHRPRLALAQKLGCKMDDDCVQTDHQQQTSVEGVYVAGDIAPLEELVVVACAMGTVAASNIHKSLST